MLNIFTVLVIVQFLILRPCLFAISHAIQNVKIEDLKIRKLIVKIHKFATGCYRALIIIIILFALMMFFIFLYNQSLNFVLSISKSFAFSEYVALSISLVTIQSLTCLLIKASKKKWYEDTKQKEMRELGISAWNEWERAVRKLPVKGIIHIINLALVVWANSFKALGIDTSITSTSIYMSIATFYAIDKTVDYFGKQYSDV